jgi:hypothetical protein
MNFSNLSIFEQNQTEVEQRKMQPDEEVASCVIKIISVVISFSEKFDRRYRSE